MNLGGNSALSITNRLPSNSYSSTEGHPEQRLACKKCDYFASRVLHEKYRITLLENFLLMLHFFFFLSF